MLALSVNPTMGRCIASTKDPVFPRISYILRITIRFRVRTSPLVTCVNRLDSNDDDIYLAKKPGYQKGHKPINAGCPYKKILYVNAPFQRYCRFSAEKSDRTPIPPEFWGVPLGLDCRCCSSEERRP